MSTVAYLAPGEAVLKRIRESSLKPTGLLADLGSEYSYMEIQDALSDLLEKGEVTLTSELFLVPVLSQENSEER